MVLAARFVGAPTASSAHPLHTTLTEVRVDATTHTVRLTCGTRRTADLRWICLEGTTTEVANETRGRNTILCDVFDD
jgi:hypothetical protein